MKRMLFLFFIFLHGCGSGGGGGDSSDRNANENEENGKWLLNCVNASVVSIDDDNIWIIERLRIDNDSFFFDWTLFTDSSCENPFPLLAEELLNQGGEILQVIEMTSRNGYLFNRYVLESSAFGRPAYYDLYYSNGALYKVSFDINEFFENEDENDPKNFIVNFNSMYVRE